MQRRDLLKKSIIGSTIFLGINSFSQAAEQCRPLKTPSQPEGPFYPVVDQIDTDADLIQLQGATQIADGKIVIVAGQVVDQNCIPVQGALVEIWQACKSGRYNHQSDPNDAPLDPHFQYWGKAVTDQNGNYKFRTIIPGAYPAGEGWVRPPHIHYKVSKLGFIELITQMYFAGEILNEKDLILKRLKKSDQEKVVVTFKNLPEAPHPVGHFNIVLEKIGL